MSESPDNDASAPWSTLLARLDQWGARVGKYSIEGLIGAGGMGRVYRAVDTELGRQIALKTLHEMSPTNLLRFKREFRSVADIAHDNLVQLYELFSDGELWLLAMELVAGNPFDEWVLQGEPISRAVTRNPESDSTRLLSVTTPIHPPNDAGLLPRPPHRGLPFRRSSEPRLRSALVQLLDAVAQLHRAGVIHRDIKPANVLIDESGRVVVLDFGVVGSTDADATSLFLGTPAYAAPEMVRGIALPSSDIYSIGCMLYQCLTGRLPFEGTPTQVLRRKELEEHPPLHEVSSGIPYDLAELCQAMLERAPVRRPSIEQALQVLGHHGTTRVTSLSGRDTPFVGRVAELGRLHAAVAASVQRGPTAAFLVGASGAGKTRLVETFLRQLGDAKCLEPTKRIRTLRGRCYEHESVPFKALDPIVDAIASSVAGARQEQWAKLPHIGFAELGTMFPVFRSLPLRASVRDTQDLTTPVAAGFSAHEKKRQAGSALAAVLSLLTTSATVVLWIDDLQWGDRDSAELLIEALTLCHGLPLLLCFTCRDEHSSFVQELKQGLLRTKVVHVEELAIGPLSQTETESLLRSHAPSDVSDEDVAKLAQEASGNPYLVEAIARHLRSHRPHPGSFSLETAFAEMLSQMHPDDLALLRTICVAGKPMGTRVLARAANVATIAPSLARLRADKLIKGLNAELGALVEPYHDRIRQVVSHMLAAEELRRVYLALGNALVELSPRANDLVADYFFFGVDLSRAHKYGMEAAEQAGRALAFDREAELYTRILDASPGLTQGQRRDLTIALADALVSAGRCAEATPHYTAAAASAVPQLRRDLLRRAAEQQMVSGDLERGVLAIRPVLRDLGLDYPASSRQAIIRLVRSIAWLELWGLRTKPGSAGPKELERADLCWSAGKGLLSSDSVRGGAFMLESLRYALRSGDQLRTARGLAVYGMIRMYEGSTGGVERGREIFRRASEVSRHLSNPYLRGLILACQGTAEMALGLFRLGLERLERSIELLRTHGEGVAWEVNVATSSTFNTLQWLGKFAEMSDKLPRWQREAKQVANGYAVAQATIYQASVDLAAGRAMTAMALANDVLRSWKHEAFTFQSWQALRASVHCHLWEGDVSSAQRKLAEGWDQLERSGLLRVHLMRVDALHVRATVLAAQAALGRTPHHSQLTKIANRLGTDPKPLAQACSMLVSAQAKELDGHIVQATNEYRSSAKMFAGIDVLVYECAAQWAVARLENKSATQAGLAARLTAAGISTPQRYLHTCAPVAVPI